MKKFVLLIATALFLIAEANAFDVRLLQNNKESLSRQLSPSETSEADFWGTRHRLGSALQKFALKSLGETFNELERLDTNCELGLVAKLQQNALKNGVISTKGEVLDLAAWLRVNNFIDDILYRIIKDSTLVTLDFANSMEGRSQRPINVYNRKTSDVDIQKYFSPVKRWPDDIKVCTIDTYYEMIKSLNWKTEKERDALLSRLNFIGLDQGLIDHETFHKLETLRRRSVLSWPVYLKRYTDVINNTKDKLTKSPETTALTPFTQEFVSRRESLTQRTQLYRTYNSTQVLMLAQIIEKTARRMDAKRATLNWQFGDNPSEQEIYILSPMEQYRAAIRFLRKDMAEVMRSEAFRANDLQYEHLIAAAYEAGFIKSEDLSMVLKFEDFWNPKTPRWKTYANFAFSLAGSATFYLPAPFNIIGAIGLVLTQTKVVDGEQRPDPNDNPNVIL